MNLSPHWVPALADAGFDAAHWSAIGAPDASDAAIMNHARETDSIVLTHELDFGAILAAGGGNAPSVVQLRLGAVDIASAFDSVVVALRQFAAELADGALITVDPLRARASLLPLRR